MEPGFDQIWFAEYYVTKNQNLFPRDREKITQKTAREFVLQLHQALVLEGIIFLEFIKFAAVPENFQM